MEIDSGVATVLAAMIGAITSIVVKMLEIRAAAGTNPPASQNKGLLHMLPWMIIAAIVTTPIGYWWGQRAQQPVASISTTNTVEYFDFATVSSDWSTLSRCDQTFSQCERFTEAARAPAAPLDRGLSYELQLDADQWSFYTIEYARPVESDVMVAQFYTPDRADIADNWFGLAALDKNRQWVAGSYQSGQRGDWTTMVLDLRRVYDGQDTSLNRQPLKFQVVYAVKGGQSLRAPSVLVGLDEVGWYQGSGEIRGSEQQGVGRHLWNFENDLPHNWTLSDTRVPTDTLQTNYDIAYRGRQSLALHTKLAPGERSAIQVALRDTPLPKGVLVAEVYLPADAPAGTRIWAELYTYAKTGWSNNESVVLIPGQWTTLVWDLRDITWQGPTITLGIQVGIDSGTYDGQIYVDDVQVFQQ